MFRMTGEFELLPSCFFCSGLNPTLFLDPYLTGLILIVLLRSNSEYLLISSEDSYWSFDSDFFLAVRNSVICLLISNFGPCGIFIVFPSISPIIDMSFFF
jgi:hypothetical protein